MADLRPDRYIEGPSLGLELYKEVAGLPIVSPHGHIDAHLFADPDARLDPPGRLFVTADHYVVRMLFSQGVPLEDTGFGTDGADDRAVWQMLADHICLFALTPTGLWLRETLVNVFGIDAPLDSVSAQAVYDRIEEQLASPGFAPRALLDRFQVEVLATTDPAGSTLADHRAIADPARIKPTFRPDSVAALDAPRWRDALAALERAGDREVGDFATYLEALASRRDAFRELGLVRGGIVAGWRLLRCNPWGHGGVDDVADRTLFRGREERSRA